MNELIQHHVKYKELHGVDEVIMITRAEHRRLHARLREEGKCNVPTKELAKISIKAHHRSEHGEVCKRRYITSELGKIAAKRFHANCQVIWFSESFGKYTTFVEQIIYNCKIGSVNYSAGFRATCGYILPIIEVK